MRSLNSVISVVGVCLFAISATVCRADEVTVAYGTNSPVNAWSYSKLVAAGKGFSVTYVPVRPDYDAAVFQGFVVTPPTGAWGGPSFSGSDTIYVFRTTVFSSITQTLPLAFGGDDGTSMYVNDVYQGGGGFGHPTIFPLTLVAGVPVRLEFAGYNGPGPWIFQLATSDEKPITSFPGVTINALPSVHPAWCGPGFWRNADPKVWALVGRSPSSPFNSTVYPTFYNVWLSQDPNLSTVLNDVAYQRGQLTSGPFSLTPFKAAAAFLTDHIPGYRFDATFIQEENSQTCPIDHQITHSSC